MKDEKGMTYAEKQAAWRHSLGNSSAADRALLGIAEPNPVRAISHKAKPVNNMPSEAVELVRRGRASVQAGDITAMTVGTETKWYEVLSVGTRRWLSGEEDAGSTGNDDYRGWETPFVGRPVPEPVAAREERERREALAARQNKERL